MASNQSLSLDQRLSMRLSAQQLRFVKLLEYNTPELEEAVERELDDNPALEVAEENEPADLELPSYRYGYSGGQRAADESANYDFSPPDSGENLYDSLLRQLAERNLSPNVLAAAEYIVGSLDSNGYLRRSLGNLINDMAFGPGIDADNRWTRYRILSRMAWGPPTSESAFACSSCIFRSRSGATMPSTSSTSSLKLSR